MSNNSNRIKVVGYAQSVNYTDGIQYRNFSPDLVGVQLASSGGTSLFTMGNFSITTNLNPKIDKTFISNGFSDFVSLSDLGLTLEQAQTLLLNNAGVILNLDKSNLSNYALFGSLTEFIRVSLEDIITNWPASLHTTSIIQTTTGKSISGNTFDNYIYNSTTNISSFSLNTNFIENKFQLNYLTNGTIANTFNSGNDLRNITVNYNSYSILTNGVEYPLLGFTGSTYNTNDVVYFTVQGNVFSGQSSDISYHIKPNKSLEEQFFNSLPDFEVYLLNRLASPIYTAKFKYPIKTESGVILYVTSSLTWPVSDGYNIDYDTTNYINYANQLLKISSDSDLYSTDLVNRFLVTDSISEFDTVAVHLDPQDQDSSDQKMNKTLRIYGAEFDEINKYITGINFANVVSYDKQDNTPDIYLKNLARVLGWGLLSSVLENDLLKNYVTTSPSTYSGQSVGLTAIEADIELWRRIVLNTPWIWKSKGARKSVEFLLNFIGTPKGLIQFNEYIYRANAPIDINLFIQALTLNGLSTDLTLYPIDSNGYPNPLPNTPNMYFQNNGLWYRETGGAGSTLDINSGNNPHLGLYDGGYLYINQFRNLIPNFSQVILSSQTITSGSTNLFINYNLGLINNYSGNTYVDAMYDDGSSLNGCAVVTSSIIPDPMPSGTITDCGCTSIADDESLSICLDISGTLPLTTPCSNSMASLPVDNTQTGLYGFSYYQYNADGSVYVDSNGNPILNASPYTTNECCVAIGGTPTLYNQYLNGVLINSGYACCDSTGGCGCTLGCSWVLDSSPIMISQSQYLNFVQLDGSNVVVSPDGCNCVANYTIPVPNITDPYTGQVGYGCQLTQQGLNDLTLGTSGILYLTYLYRNTGNIGCTNIYTPKSGGIS